MARKAGTSTIEKLLSTAAELALSFPEANRSRWHRKGMSHRSERIFNLASAGVLVTFALGWSWSIANARAGGETGVTPATGRITSALTKRDAPSVAYLTDAVLGAVTGTLDPLRGESGKLRARLAEPGSTVIAEPLPSGVLATMDADNQPTGGQVRAPQRVGVWKLALGVSSALKPLAEFSVITLRPAADSRGGRIGLYFIGSWPTARKTTRATYTPPSGFIEVTKEKQGTFLSEHFRLRDFLPHDQANVWPKYLVVEMKLVDKLELILLELEKSGIRTSGVRVMSGFRTPQYNSGVGETAGRASLSRHMYGDAADIFIDSNGDGNMDDLNRDGRINIGDARVILAAVNRVEAAHPSLIGGVGVYSGNGAHGPFTHIDTRGYPARW